MQIIQKDFYNVSRSDIFKIVPISDVHDGVKPCQVNELKRVVSGVQEGDNTYWIGLGDFCDFVNRSDPRYSPTILADWFTVAQTADIARAQSNHFIEIIKPIAHKCLGLVAGNHETAITRHYERDIYYDIVSAIKNEAGLSESDNLAFGYDGWLLLNFYRTKIGERKGGLTRIVFNLHHGFTGGQLAGAKALNMQRRLWTRDCDICLMGHSHNTEIQMESVEYVDRSGNFRTQKRRGAFCGTFLDTTIPGIDTYTSMRGYLPMPVSGIEITLRPGAKLDSSRIRITAW